MVADAFLRLIETAGVANWRRLQAARSVAALDAAAGNRHKAALAAIIEVLSGSQGIFGFKTVTRLSESCFPGGTRLGESCNGETPATCLADRTAAV